MTKALRIQGVLFCIGSLLLIPLAMNLYRLEPQVQLLVMAAVIILLGVPHGALDTVFAQRAYRMSHVGSWATFVVLYFVPVVAVVVLWTVAPLLFLVGFLLISIFHFSGDPAPDTPFLVRLLYGGAIVVLPTLWHADDVTTLFSLLVGSEAAVTMVAILSPLAWPWLVGLGIASLVALRRDGVAAGELAAVTLLATLAPPLPAFTIFFCGMHSARHILRTVYYVGAEHWRVLLLAGGLPIIGIIGMFAVALLLPSVVAIDARVIRIVFVGLAALTVPHMAIVERIRFAGWTPRRSDG
ncbi:Brp/Blh family beta-carotene 15,15'-dioxygenase [Lichenihabitans sp. PAMC28606]|uniref:Brp/Blh family beta-carotene 15,15'-dioxygenase n=1 Tax=Lichenihabitans sp. PAMC28606 TaxID=2880932 RepID=UPI001D09EFF4|nr:Brp/Blh family beta-carotene 15,15'-dioxygenase [Lichenihabitans sp. PAMC28606]UDL93079.1 Brp/Blh family beta-carotene 15,15'-dioxygenase [Lichenihabitans sp. PAMC28606]